MSVEAAELDQMQKNYKDAVEEWIAAIRYEESLASGNHSETELDEWELAADKQEDAAEKVADAKIAYEDALREKFFNF